MFVYRGANKLAKTLGPFLKIRAPDLICVQMPGNEDEENAIISESPFS